MTTTPPSVAPTPFYAHDLVRSPLWARKGNQWPIDATFAAELDRRLALRQPRVILELGAGASTMIFARYAEATGAKVVSLEYDAAYAESVRGMLELCGIDRGAVDIQVCPLTTSRFGRPDGSAEVVGPWYHGAVLPEEIDFVLIDAPSLARGGRAATLPKLAPYLRSDGEWEVWLDDANRPEERACIQAWRAIVPDRPDELGVRFLPFGKKGAAVLSYGSRAYEETPAGALPMDASDVCVTILTGRRPAMLARLLDSLAAEAPGLIETAHVVALHNGGADRQDEITRRVLDRVPGSIIETSSLYGIGRATSLLENAARKSGMRYWLHLEDDWRLATADAGWLGEAKRAATKPDVAQVRLRHYSEPVLDRHMVTHDPIAWGRVNAADASLGGFAHLTFNPFLSLTGRMTRAFPVVDERDLQTRGHALGLRRVVQLYPGAFVHTGGESGGSLSLRANGGAK